MGKLILKFVGFSFLILVFSCNKYKVIEEKGLDKAHIFKKYYKDDKLYFIETYYNEILLSRYNLLTNEDKISDTLYYYVAADDIVNAKEIYMPKGEYYSKHLDKNGNVLAEGKVFNSKNVGWWKIYDKYGKLSHENYITYNKNGQREYSQLKIYDENEKINELQSNYISFKIPDTIYLGKNIGEIIQNKPNFNDHLAYYACIGYEIEPDFSNIMNVKIDSFPIMNKKRIGLNFTKLGRNLVRGFIYESKIDRINDTNFTIDIINVNFEKEFYVIPRPDSIPKNKVIYYD
nr:hypothetical protein [uncultured Flavobacterium sp.]